MSARRHASAAMAVVIGASAGGVEALRRAAGRAAGALPRRGRWWCIHLPPRPAERPRCACSAALRAAGARGRATRSRSRPGTVYVAPPDYHLLVEPRPTVRAVGRRAGAFLAAVDRRAVRIGGGRLSATRLLGVVLTGANADGSAGCAAVRAAGGAGVGAGPRDADAPAMPAAALAHAGADAVLSLDEMVGRLAACP